jgi:hypothetical protein
VRIRREMLCLAPPPPTKPLNRVEKEFSQLY